MKVVRVEKLLEQRAVAFHIFDADRRLAEFLVRHLGRLKMAARCGARLHTDSARQAVREQDDCRRRVDTYQIGAHKNCDFDAERGANVF